MGIIPRGPLAALRKTWTAERELPPDLDKMLQTKKKQIRQILELKKNIFVITFLISLL